MSSQYPSEIHPELHPAVVVWPVVPVVVVIPVVPVVPVVAVVAGVVVVPVEVIVEPPVELVDPEMVAVSVHKVNFFIYMDICLTLCLNFTLFGQNFDKNWIFYIKKLSIEFT